MPLKNGNIYAQTVIGPIAPDQLGVTLTHEHLIMDGRCNWIEPPSNYSFLSYAQITPDIAYNLRHNPQYSQPNLELDDECAAIEDLAKFVTIGGNSIVDLTSIGLSPQPSKLLLISLNTGAKTELEPKA